MKLSLGPMSITPLLVALGENEKGSIKTFLYLLLTIYSSLAYPDIILVSNSELTTC
jgi:hypothetical protein